MHNELIFVTIGLHFFNTEKNMNDVIHSRESGAFDMTITKTS